MNRVAIAGMALAAAALWAGLIASDLGGIKPMAGKPVEASEANRLVQAEIWEAWAGLNLTAGRGTSILVAAEFGEPDAGMPERHEELVEVCGPAPVKPVRSAIVPGKAVRVLAVGAVQACTGAGSKRSARGAFPDGSVERFGCACSQGPSCKVTSDGGWLVDAPVNVTLSSWGGNCARKTCVEAAEVADREGLGYSMPAECQ